jgi:beta-mannosidase
MKSNPIIFAVCFLLLAFAANAQLTTVSLNNGWQFSRQGENKWHAAKVPGTIHTDLLFNKLIPDPYYRDNEKKLQWIDKENWEYKTHFSASVFPAREKEYRTGI